MPPPLPGGAPQGGGGVEGGAVPDAPAGPHLRPLPLQPGHHMHHTAPGGAG